MAVEYLKELLKKKGVSGDEGEVREFIYNECKKSSDEVYVDNLGSVIATKFGKKDKAKCIMGSAHMDEVGFIVQGVDDNGYISFLPVGGVDPRILPATRLKIGVNEVSGVIGIKPIHFLEKEDIKKPIAIDKLCIDIGAASKEDALKYVNIGDTIIYDSEIVEFGDNLLKSRSLDDRVGCAILLKALEGSYDYTFVAVFSVEEEVGLIGSRVASHKIKPDLAIVLEGTTCADMHGVEDGDKVTTVNKGAAITLMDRATIPNKNLKDFIVSTAEKNKINYQFREGTFGGTDAGAIQRARDGVPVAHISTPCRYIHSPVSVCSLNDFECATKLFIKTLTNIHDYFNEKA